MITPEERAEIIRETTEHVLSMLPNVILYIMRNQKTLQDAAKKFYEDNKDLVTQKELVGKVVEGLEMKFPGETPEQLLARAAPEVRKILDLKRSAESRPSVNRTALDKVLGNL